MQRTWDLTAARYLALMAAMVGTMVGEYHLAIRTGSPAEVAWAYPVALDIYAYAAFRAGRKADVATALVLVGLSQAGAHLPQLHGWVISVAPWAIVLPIVLWRVHSLSHIAVDTAEDPRPGDAAPGDAEPEAAEPEATEDEPEAEVIPMPTRGRWSQEDGWNAIQHWQAQGLATDKEIAERMKITPQRVGQIRRAALKAAAA